MRLLPFNFEQLPSQKYFISNMAGFHTCLEPNTFNALVHQESLEHNTSRELEGRLFISSDYDAYVAKAALSSGLAKKLLQELQFSPVFMIVPTLRCDHDCNYCQVSKASLGASNYDMDSRQIPKIIDLIRKLSPGPYKLEIQGGEPLVRFDLVQEIYDQAAKELGEDRFEMVITTSLSLLSDEILTWAKPRKVYFSTSLDGTEGIHNKNRLLTGDSSFGRLKGAVQRIHEQLGIQRVSTVSTVTPTLFDNPEALIEAHLELGIHHLFVRPISPYGFAVKDVDLEYGMESYMRFYEALFDAIVRRNFDGIPLVEHSAAIHLKRVFNPGFNNYADLKSPSGVLLNCLLFNYDGRVFGSDEARMLQRLTPSVDFSLGTVESLTLEASPLYRSSVASSFSVVQPGCATCAFQPYCGSDPCQNIGMQGEPVGDKSMSIFCQYHKGMFRFLLDRYYNDEVSRQILSGWRHA